MPPRARLHTAARPPVRSLADDIRGRTDEELSRLVLGRPDLARPAPADLTSLAARASTRASVQRCIETLDRAHLQVLEAVVVAPDRAGPPEVAGLLGTDRDVSPLLDRLWELALVWHGPDGLQVVRTVPEVLGPYPGGLGPSTREITGVPGPGPEELRSLVDSAPEAATSILERLTWGPPVGVLSPQGPGAAGARWLLAHGLLAPVPPAPHPMRVPRFDSSTPAPGEGPGVRVVLPREVGLVLRGGGVHRETRLDPPDQQRREVGYAAADAAAGGQVSDLLALVEEVANRWGPEPPRVLRTGGLAVRDLRHLAVALDLETDRAAWLVEVMFCAGLVADDGEIVPVWAPTRSFDEWLGQDAGTRWARVATAWFASTRAAHLVGARPAATPTPANALGPDVHWPPIRAIRAEVLGELARLDPGEASTTASVVERLQWRRPLRNAALLEVAATAALHEAEWLGATGRGALSSAGRALASGADAPALSRLMSGHLPSPVDHVLIQADLTAIAPGPLEGSLAALMRLSAEVESRGGATVHRFTQSSVRRALDIGWTADELVDSLRRSSRTGLPQPVEYLVRDVARRHGQTRIGGATAYIRSDDEAVLESMVADRALAALQLRRIATSVLISPADPLVLIELLRDSGYAPVQERPDGTVVVSATRQRRAAARRPAAPPTVTPVDATFTASLVHGLRAAEESADFRRSQEDPDRPRLEPTDPTVTLAALRDAAADRHGVWIGHADMDGRTERILFYPDRVESGRAYGTVKGEAHERGFSIHRITGVAQA